MSILLLMINSAFAPIDAGVGTDYSSASVDLSKSPNPTSTTSTTSPPAFSNASPPKKSKKSGSIFKFFGLGVLIAVLIGGLITAYVLTQQQQEIRQQAGYASSARCTNQDGEWRIEAVGESYDPSGASYTGMFNVVPPSSLSHSTEVKLDLLKFFCPLAIGQQGSGPPSTNGQCNLQWYVHTVTGERIRYTSDTISLNFDPSSLESKRVDVVLSNAPPRCGGYQLDLGFDSIISNGQTTQCSGIILGNLAHAGCVAPACTLPGYTADDCRMNASCPADALTTQVQADQTLISVRQNVFANTSLQPKIQYRKYVSDTNAGPWQYCELNSYTCVVPESFYANFTAQEKLQTAVEAYLIQTTSNVTLNVCNWRSQWVPADPLNYEYLLGSCSNQCNQLVTLTVGPSATPTPTGRPSATPTPTGRPSATPTPTPTGRPSATPTPTGRPSATPTPTPTTKPSTTPTPTPTATPAPFGGMCLSISSIPAVPKYNDSVSFACGLVVGVNRYEFRYFEPGSLNPISLAASSRNISQTIKVNKVGTYTAQCRICPEPTSQYTYCKDPNWGWDPISAATD